MCITRCVDGEGEHHTVLHDNCEEGPITVLGMQDCR